MINIVQIVDQKYNKKGLIVVKKKLGSIYYSVVYEFVIIPILGLITYLLYEKFAYSGIILDNFFLYFILILLLVLFNIFGIYAIAYIYNKVYKIDNNYYTLVGGLTIGIVIWFKVFWYVMEGVNCNTINDVNCVPAIQYNKLSTVILVISISYFLIYQILYKMISKKMKLNNGKK